MKSQQFSANGRTYAMPAAPVVVICIDGSEPDYHVRAMAAGHMPWLSHVLDTGASCWDAHCAMPALTNPNNLSIATGHPPAVHGISGNYLFDPERDEEVLMNDEHFLRVPTIFAAASDAGLDVAVITAKDKLCRLLGAGLVRPGRSLDGSAGFTTPRRRGICFSAEKADRATLADNNIDNVLDLVARPLPDVYSAALSEFTLAAGLAVFENCGADIMYLSLTDYIQHKHAPGAAAANSFYEMIDSYAARFDAMGAVVVLTADHGMSAKTDRAGNPKILYIDDEVRRALGLSPAPHGCADLDGVRVVLPITDPYTAHHGALGSFASVYLPADVDHATVIDRLRALDGVEEASARHAAAERYRLPADRIGDVVLLADAATVMGRYPQWHDLSGLDAPLRSHGGLGELQVPFLINRRLPRPPLLDEPFGQPAYLHNYDAFWIATTGVSQYETRSAPAV